MIIGIWAGVERLVAARRGLNGYKDRKDLRNLGVSTRMSNEWPSVTPAPAGVQESRGANGFPLPRE